MRDYEKKIIQALLSRAGQQKIALPEDDTNIEIEYTGAGYFLSFKNDSVPKKRIVLNEPNISGHLGGISVGFVAFIENSEFTLECYTFEKNISQGCRDDEFIPNAT